MKRKDVISLVIAALIFVVAGYLVYTQLMPKSASTAKQQGTQIEVVGSIESNFDSGTLSQLGDSSQVHDYAIPFDLTTGLGNQSVFGQ